MGMVLAQRDGVFTVADFKIPKGVSNPALNAVPPLLVGDRIVRVNGIECKSAGHLGQLVKDSERTLILGIERVKENQSVVVF